MDRILHNPVRNAASGARIGLLAVVAAAGLVPCAWARPGTPTNDLVLTGRVRDFPPTHPDFCINPSIGGWVEGLAADTVDGNGRPVLSGAGKRVTAGATDAAGHTISTSLISETVVVQQGGVKLVSAPTYSNNPTVDSYNPAAGFYGPGNIGPAPTISTGQTMPAVVAPNITPVIGEYLKDGNATSTLNSNFRCSKFLIRNYHKLHISGNVVVVVDEEFKVENYAQINLNPGATFTVYAKKDATIQDNCSINMNTGDHTRFTFYRLGTLDFYLQNGSSMCGTVICPTGRVFMSNSANLYGTVTSKQLHMQNSSGLHIAQTSQAGCSMLDDNPAVLGATDSGNVTNGQTFSQWFQDTPGTNMSAQARLVFSQDAQGAYTFSSDDFRPIDGKLLDAGKTTPNRNFTYEMEGEFTYQPCTKQFFQFSGDGDAFVYVDGKLVMELAGHGTNVTQYVDMERLGFAPGSTHKLQFFYASRSCNAAGFTVKTNMELRTKYTVEFEAIAIMD